MSSLLRFLEDPFHRLRRKLDLSEDDETQTQTIMAESAQEHFVASVAEEEREISCWGCGLRLILPSSASIFKCGWCGAITNQNARKGDNKWFWWKRLRDRCFVSVLLAFMLFVICGGIWAVYPVVFSIGLFSAIFHSTITIILSVTTILTFSLSAFRCAGKPPTIVWGSYPVVGKGDLENYTFCRDCSRPKSPRTHHCRSCGMCVLDMDHHCPFIGNCVGAGNHQNFVAFLISAVAGTTYAAIMCVYIGLKMFPPLKSRPVLTRGFSHEMAFKIIKGVILEWLGSALLLSARGLILFYLFVSSISVATGLSVLLWQQLSYIYEGKTYLSHLRSSEDENGAADKDCNNIIRFLGCPYFMSRYFTNLQNSRKSHRK